MRNKAANADDDNDVQHNGGRVIAMTLIRSTYCFDVEEEEEEKKKKRKGIGKRIIMTLAAAVAVVRRRGGKVGEEI